MPQPVLTVVVPMFDEEEVLPLFVERLRPALAGLGVPYEVLVVDDGSRDRTPVLLQQHRRAWPGPGGTTSSPSTPTCRTPRS